jgi:serine protease Do
MVGETVIAVGNPLGLSNTLTRGIISATDRSLRFGDESVFEGLIQTDAPINPGNSGGPLLNIKGEFIGINTAIRADAQNIGFAIPVDRLGDELVDLLDVERMKRLVFGARIVRPRGTPTGGLLVQQVRVGTPAAEALQAGDRVVAIDGEPVDQLTDYVFAMLAAEPGRALRFTVRREGVEHTVAITLAERPLPDGRKLAQRLLGLTLREITPALAREWSLPARSGLVVVGIDRDGPADRIGVELKDVVFQVGRIHVGDLDELGAVLENVRPGQALRIGVARRNIVAWATLRTAGEQ